MGNNKNKQLLGQFLNSEFGKTGDPRILGFIQQMVAERAWQALLCLGRFELFRPRTLFLLFDFVLLVVVILLCILVVYFRNGVSCVYQSYTCPSFSSVMWAAFALVEGWLGWLSFDAVPFHFFPFSWSLATLILFIIFDRLLSLSMLCGSSSHFLLFHPFLLA